MKIRWLFQKIDPDEKWYYVVVVDKLKLDDDEAEYWELQPSHLQSGRQEALVRIREDWNVVSPSMLYSGDDSRSRPKQYVLDKRVCTQVHDTE